MTAASPPALPTKRVLETALRGAGLSARQARKLLSGGYAAIGGDDSMDDLKVLLAATIKRLDTK